MNDLKVCMFKPYVPRGATQAVTDVLASGNLTLGPKVAEFEKQFGEYIGNPYCVAVNSCTSALHMALELVGVRGGEVITTPQTMEATGLAILMAGGKLVFADIDPMTGNLDPQSVKAHISENTRAILVVHWGGYPCDLEQINSISLQFGLSVIEDAAHALGATYNHHHIGVHSRFVCFSFQAIKHITSGGDGGMLCINFNLPDYNRARRMRWYGIDRDRRTSDVLGDSFWPITELGYKYNMNDLDAALGLCGLRDLNWVLERRALIAAKYKIALKRMDGITLPPFREDIREANWLFTMHVERREDFCRAMRSRGIEVSVVHRRIDRHPIFGAMDKMDTLPGATEFDRTQINLPLHCDLSTEDVATVIDAVKEGW